MFLVGLEFDLELIRKRMKSAVFVSWAGIATPFALGALLAWGLMDRFPLFAPGVKVWEAALFMGSAMSITAFPMLARIIYERGLSGTSLGTLALAAGSLDDAAAWCLLAVVLASFTGKMSIALLALFGGGVLRPVHVHPRAQAPGAALRLAPALPSREPRLMLPAAAHPALLAAWLTDTLGIYAVFGAFVFGAAMPRGALQKRLEGQIGPLTAVYLLPMFFINSGLNTTISLHRLAGDAGHRGAACWWRRSPARGSPAASRRASPASRSEDSFAIGALMNARGLMELILLNIGYERGMITQTLFTILVIMAVVTTIMAVPLFNRVYRPGDAAPA